MYVHMAKFIFDKIISQEVITNVEDVSIYWFGEHLVLFNYFPAVVDYVKVGKWAKLGGREADGTHAWAVVQHPKSGLNDGFL